MLTFQFQLNIRLLVHRLELDKKKLYVLMKEKRYKRNKETMKERKTNQLLLLGFCLVVLKRDIQVDRDKTRKDYFPKELQRHFVTNLS